VSLIGHVDCCRFLAYQNAKQTVDDSLKNFFDGLVAIGIWKFIVEAILLLAGGAAYLLLRSRGEDYTPTRNRIAAIFIILILIFFPSFLCSRISELPGFRERREREEKFRRMKDSLEQERKAAKYTNLRD